MKKLSVALFFVTFFAANVLCQSFYGETKTAALESRRSIDGKDNYADATFSFEKGVNGEAARELTRNDWDLQFFTSRRNDGAIVGDFFGVTMVVDDCSRIKDLGALDWSDNFEIPNLPAHEKPTREPDVKAIVGHIYLVHTKDSETDLHALFRVEELKSGESVKISWKLISNLENK